MKEYGKQQQLRNEIICSEENADDMMDTDDLYGQCEDEPADISVRFLNNKFLFKFYCLSRLQKIH